MSSTISDTDRAHLATAIAYAEQARATASPNPGVGCLIVGRDGVVGHGQTSAPGGPHAEIRALTAAGTNARHATAYVTLSPCGHHGRTPPCADALAAAGVRRVVVALADPWPPAAAGLATLQRAGVEVAVLEARSVLARAVAAQLEGHLTVQGHGRPHITLKLAQTVDGHLTADGRRWVTGSTARRAVHVMRSNVDAVLVGSGTVLADDPRLDARGDDDLPLPGRQPRPVVIDTRLRISPEATIVGRGAIVLTSPIAAADTRAALQQWGAEIHPLPVTGGRVDLHAAVRLLASLGITRVLAEPGRTLASALLDADLVDRLVLHVAAGEGNIRPALLPSAGATWRRVRVGGAGADAVIVFSRDVDPTRHGLAA